MPIQNLKVIIAAGGTGGHIYPGIALAEQIREDVPNAHITFVGTSRGLEQRVIPAMGWQLVMIKSSRYKGVGRFQKAMTLIKIPFSVLSAMRIVKARKPDLLICIGGYAAGPLSIAAWMLRVPIALVEPNAIPGMTNRILGRFARLIFTAFDEASAYFNVAKVIKYGVPVRKDVMNVRHDKKEPGERFTIFVFGGSQGAKRLNEAMAAAAKELSNIGDKIFVIHQTGNKEVVPEITAAYRNARIGAQVFDFTDKIWEMYEKADFVIARSGAATVAELAALAIPSALVPYPFAADDHQRANADALVRIGGAKMIADSECTGIRFARMIRELINKPEELIGMRRALMSCGSQDAAKRIVAKCMDILAK